MAGMTLDGSLFVYGATDKATGANGLVAMRSGRGWSKKAVLHVAGLTDGLLSMPWAAPLARAVDEVPGYCFVQPVLSSSYLGYGVSSLEEDASELATLLGVMKAHGVERVVLVGHSTGCQDAVALLREQAVAREMVAGAVLVGPVSDREAFYMFTDAEVAEARVEEAREMVEAGRGDQLLPRSVDPAPITAARFLSLNGKGSAEDMFNSDEPAAALAAKLAPCAGIPTHVILSTKDEYVPAHVDVAAQAARLCAALGPRAAHTLLPDNHTIVKPECQEALIKAVVAFLGRVENE